MSRKEKYEEACTKAQSDALCELSNTALSMDVHFLKGLMERKIYDQNNQLRYLRDRVTILEEVNSKLLVEWRKDR